MNTLAMNEEKYTVGSNKVSVMDRVKNYFRDNAETIIDAINLMNGNYSSYVYYKTVK